MLNQQPKLVWAYPKNRELGLAFLIVYIYAERNKIVHKKSGYTSRNAFSNGNDMFTVEIHNPLGQLIYYH